MNITTPSGREIQIQPHKDSPRIGELDQPENEDWSQELIKFAGSVSSTEESNQLEEVPR
jgi:hypothetical protein